MIKRGIFKANDIRGITEGPDPEWDASGAYAIGPLRLMCSTSIVALAHWLSVATCESADR